jgi:AcrR family transcriptional regulator
MLASRPVRQVRYGVMEAATTGERTLAGDKAARIVDAMRASVAERGTAGSTFDQVARAAGVSRGLLHYYFGTKERLLVEVVRRDCDVRMAALDEYLAQARTADDFIAVLVGELEDVVRNDPGFVTLLFELFVLSRRHEEVAAEFSELLRRTREQVAALLRAKEAEGVLHLSAEPDAVVDVLFSLADGIWLRMLAEDRDFGPTIAAGITCVRALLDDPE